MGRPERGYRDGRTKWPPQPDPGSARTRGHEAIEIVGEGLGEKRAPILGVHQYIRKGNTVLLVSFWARKGDFANHDTAMRQAIETIRIE